MWENAVGSAVRIVGILALSAFFWLLVGGFALATEEGRDDFGGSQGAVREEAEEGVGEGSGFTSRSASKQSSQSSSRRLRSMGPASADSLGESVLTVRPRSLLRRDDSDEDGYDQTYQRVEVFAPDSDQVLDRLINLSTQLADGSVSEGLWKDFVWTLQHWIIDRSWYGGQGELGVVNSPENIQLINLVHVPEWKVFLERLVAIQKTFDDRWTISGESVNAIMLRHLKGAVGENIRKAFLVTARRGTVRVVSGTAQVVSSLWSVAGKYPDNLSRSQLNTGQWLKRVEVLAEVSDNMRSLVRFARTPTDLQQAMAVMETAARCLDGEERFNTLSPIGLMGLRDLHLLEQARTSSVRYQQLLKYVRDLLNGDLKGLMPVDLVLMNQLAAYQGVTIFTLPDGRPVALTSEIIRANMFKRLRTKGKTFSGLNMKLFELLCSQAGESPGAFHEMPAVWGLSNVCDDDGKPCLEAGLAREVLKRLQAFMAGEGMAPAASPPPSPPQNTSSVAKKRKRTTTISHGEEGISPVDAVGTPGMSSAPILPTTTGSGGKP